MIVFEDRSTYDEKIDAVASLTVTVECSPGEAKSLAEHAASFGNKAGVYSVDVVVANGEADAEQPIQPASGPGEADDCAGQEATVERAEGTADADSDGELAGTPGSGAAEGSVERSSGGKSVRPRSRSAGRKGSR